MPIGTMRGDGKAENPCVRRFRHRRLCSWLWLQGLQATAESMLNESDAIFDLRRLRGFVVGGRWSDALRYLARFLPPPDTRRPLSAEAMALRLFLGAHRSLANIVAGEDGSAAMYGQYLSHDRTLCHGAIRLRSIMLNVLCSRQQVRDSIDWECVRLKAALIVYTLVHRTPELKELVFRPDGPINKPHNVLPSSYWVRVPPEVSSQKTSPLNLAKHYLGKTSPRGKSLCSCQALSWEKEKSAGYFESLSGIM